LTGLEKTPLRGGGAPAPQPSGRRQGIAVQTAEPWVGKASGVFAAIHGAKSCGEAWVRWIRPTARWHGLLRAATGSGLLGPGARGRQVDREVVKGLMFFSVAGRSCLAPVMSDAELA
jgi:hypothetical protein